MALGSMSGIDRPKVLFITPIVPAPTGNGLAMRASVTLQGLASACRVTTAVLPVSGTTADQQGLMWSGERSDRLEVISLAEPAEAVRDWMASAEGREIAAAVGTLPDRARLASPRAVSNVIGDGYFDHIWVFRLYLAAAALPFRGAGTRLLLDLDEDEATTLWSIAALDRLRGASDTAARNQAEATSYERFALQMLGHFDQIITASDRETSTLGSLYPNLPIATVPNAIPPAPGWTSSSRAARSPSILFVGNFDYPPNQDAAERLATTILPNVRKKWPGAELHLAGAGQRVTRFAQCSGVEVHGFVGDLTPLFRQATMTVVPLRAGGGSRLKILEAFANGLPVVATTKAAEGLDVRAGVQLLLGETDAELASHVDVLTLAPDFAADLAAEARRFVEAHHDAQSIATRIADLVRN